MKKLTGAYSFPPFGKVVLLSLKSTCEGNEVAMDKFLAVCREILDVMPRNPGPSAENANKSSAICQDCSGQSSENTNKSSTICRDCQELPLKHACQECRVCLGCRLIRQPRQPINSETEFAKASQGPADEFIVRDKEFSHVFRAAVYFEPPGGFLALFDYIN